MRRGFTLLEVVLALSLTVILLGASTTFLWELADRRSTLARGSRDLHAGAVLMERIEADLSAGLVGDPGVGTGVEGTETRLKLLTRGVWLAPAEGQAEAPAAQGDLQASEFVFDPATARLSARRYAVKPGSGGGAGGELELISDRVERVRFRYYDGRGWRSSFDSVKEGTLPVAIEVAVWFTALKNATAPPMTNPNAPSAEPQPEDEEEAPADEVNSAAVDMDDFETERRWPEPDRLRVIIVPDGPASSWKEGA